MIKFKLCKLKNSGGTLSSAFLDSMNTFKKKQPKQREENSKEQNENIIEKYQLS